MFFVAPSEYTNNIITYRFEMEKEHLIEFTEIATKKAETSEYMLNRVVPKDNIALCAVLKLKEAVYGNCKPRFFVTVFQEIVTHAEIAKIKLPKNPCEMGIVCA
jgi:hypothetical protein